MSADIKLLYVIVVATGLSFVQITDMVLSGNAEVVVNVGSVAAGVGLLVASLMLLRRGWPTGRVSVLILVFGIFWYLVILGTCLYGSRVLG